MDLKIALQSRKTSKHEEQTTKQLFTQENKQILKKTNKQDPGLISLVFYSQ